MQPEPERLFVPGFGAPAGLYELPPGWQALDPPTFVTAAGSLAAFRRWLLEEVDRRPGGVELAGHSMGGALAIAAAAERPELVRRLVLIGPAGVPLAKPIPACLRDFTLQVSQHRYAPGMAYRAVRRVLRAPLSALRVAQALRHADLSAEMECVRKAGIPATVVGCATDTLTTPACCRRISELLGGSYVELTLAGGHMWMLDAWPQLGRVLA